MIPTRGVTRWVTLGSLILDCVSGAPLADLLSQPNARHPPKHDELRPIEWGDLNFLHTTDTHGWFAGHMLERQFGGDWGDFVSFSERMHELADAKGVDLIMVDSGDRHDGNGFSDASQPDGALSLPIFCEADYDVVTIGNHELYRGDATLQEFRQVRKCFGDRYVVSNVEIAIGHTWVPMGEKYRVFTTKNQNITVLALGFLFNFAGNDKQMSRVTRVEAEIEKPWFSDLLRDVVPTVDHVVVVGHIPARGFPEFEYILNKIRTVRDDVPVSMFGGHSHIRDYKQYDDRAAALQSGRYVETIGWASVNTTDYTFARSYIDFNQKSMAFHADTDMESLAEDAREISTRIARGRKQLNLDERRAYVPRSYYTDRAPFPSKQSLYTLLQEKVLPLLTSPAELEERTRYILLNTGAVRFDLFEGPYTKDSGYILSPFKNEWFYLNNIPRDVADQILPIINGYDRVALAFKSPGSDYGMGPIGVFGDNVPSFGYLTWDDLGSSGDDTVHRPWKFYPVPNAFQTICEGTEDRDSVVMVFHDFMASFVESALKKLKRENLYKPKYHGGEYITDLIPQYFRYHDRDATEIDLNTQFS